MLPIAIQLYSVRDDMEKDFEGTLRAIKSYGYDGVELAGFYGKTAEEVQAILSEIGLTPVSAHVGIDLMRADMEQVIRDYNTVGCKYIAVPWLNPEDRLTSENAEKTVSDIRRFTKMAMDNGLIMCYHNHDFEFERINGEYAFDLLYSEIPEIMVEQDSCWVAVSGENPSEYLKKYSGRTPLLHLKDFVGTKADNTFELRPNGYGVQNFMEIIKTAEENGVEWLIVEQDEPSMDKSRLECAKLSIEYLETLR